MKLDKKQIPQLIVLGVLVLICIGYVSFKVMSPAAPPPAPLQQPDSAKTEVKGSDESAATDAQDEIVQNSVFPDLASTPARRDPFTPVVLPGSSVMAQEPPVNVVVDKPKPVRIVTNPTAKVPRITTPPFNPFSQMSAKIDPTPQPVVVPDPDPQFTLTGVIRGDQNVAIIRMGDGGRYVVKQGQLIDGRYKVLSVYDDGATLVYKNRRIHVKLGGVKNAS